MYSGSMRNTTGISLLVAAGYIWYQERTIERLRKELGRCHDQQVVIRPLGSR